MGSLDDLRDFDVDLRPRRTYELDEDKINGKSQVGIAIGFIVAGFFVFLKEVLFAADSLAEQTSHRSNGNKKKGLDLAPAETNLSDESEDQLEGDPPANLELPALSELDSDTLVDRFLDRTGRPIDTTDLTHRSGGGAPLRLVASNDIPSTMGGSASPFSSSQPVVVTPLSLVAPGGATGSARAVVNGDSVIIEGDDPGNPDYDPPNDDPTGGGSTNPPQNQKNRAPLILGTVALGGLLVNQSTILAASQLLLLTTDPDGDELGVKGLYASSGNLSLIGEGQWNFTPELNFTGTVTFSYDVSDGEFDIPNLALLEFSQVPGQTLIGTEFKDALIGTPGNDVIDGLGGNDLILGRSGDDIIRGGSGDDRIIAGSGDDTIYGGDGNDLILGGDGDDVIFGGNGDDTIFGEGGSDLIFGEAGDDSLNGGEGNDIVEGGKNNDQIWGESGNDLLDGGEGEDLIYAGDGDDVIIGGRGADVAHGGANDDIFIADMDDGDDDYYGDDGFDTYDISRTLAGAKINLAAGTASSSDIGSDSLTEIENIIGSQGDDIVSGDDGDNTLHGEGGDDSIFASFGNDIVIGGAGDDTLHGHDGDDLIYGGNGDDRLEGDDGNDILVGSNGEDRLDGEDGDDLLFGGNGEDRLRGEDGDDTLFGGDGADDIEGNDGNDTIIGGFGNDSAKGGKGDDLFIAEVGDGDDIYSGDDGVDTYDLSQTTADATIDLAAGYAVSLDIGLDQIDGFENVTGGSGDDILMANDDVNVLRGGPGNDIFVFRSVTEAGLGQSHRDHIEDFEIGDRIDISFIDADEDEAGNQSFEFVLDSNTQIKKGSLVLRYEIDDDDEDAIVTIIAGFIYVDQNPDFEISLSGRHNLDEANFIGVNFIMNA